MQLSSPMAKAKMLWTQGSAARHSATQGPRGHGKSTSFLLPSRLLQGQAGPWSRLPHRGMELLISAANAEVTEGFCTLGKRKEAGEREEGGLRGAPGWRPGRGRVDEQEPQSVRPPRGLCARRLSISVRSSAPAPGTRGRRLRPQSAPRPRSLGLCGPGCHRRCFCAVWAAGSSTGLCCARDGWACSQTGRCVPWSGPIPGRGAPRCRSWNLKQARPTASPAGQSDHFFPHTHDCAHDALGPRGVEASEMWSLPSA